MVECGVRLLFTVQNPEPAVEILFFKGIELFAEVRKRVCAHYRSIVRPFPRRDRQAPPPPVVGIHIDYFFPQSELPDGAGRETADFTKGEGRSEDAWWYGA